MVRPKVRRFVFMKGDPGPPGVKGRKIKKQHKLMIFSNFIFV